MYTLLISIAALLLGYFVYGAFVEKVIGPDPKKPTPAYSSNDGIDFVPLPTWKVFMIQLLNIAGTGPIFGAIAGALFGPACYLWIVLGCIFAGAVHDYLAGMLSLNHGGANLPELIGEYLGRPSKAIMLCFSVLLLLLVGAVFVYSPAVILGGMFKDGFFANDMVWVGVVLIYYIIATLVPVDKIIGRIYPIFAISIIFMAVSMLVFLIIKWPVETPEIWDGLHNLAPEKGRIFPCLFITIACGAISGFHATQSPIMARCIKNEKLGRPIFYGSMITEGAIALIWAAVASYFFHGGGAEAMGAVDPATGAISVTAAPAVVTLVSKKWLGVAGSILAMLGVVAAPITSGDTALRSCRLIIADALKVDQKPILKRLLVSIPIFLVCARLLQIYIGEPDGFDIIWRYFGWSNQTLAVFTLWALTVYLSGKKGLYYLITLIPACFMTSVCLTFILTAKIGFGITDLYAPSFGVAIFLISLGVFYLVKFSIKKTGESN
ncbi:MAG: carbon starvation protein A [Bacteroidales bacterium]|nr:carbon starvation protein A [Bacteroidales bacterium]